MSNSECHTHGYIEEKQRYLARLKRIEAKPEAFTA